MHRIDTATAQKDKFGAGKNGFARGNPQTGTPATDLDDDYFDMIQEELCRVVEESGEELDKGKHDQLLTALRALLLSRSNPFGDIASDGPAAIAKALTNLRLGYLSFDDETGTAKVSNGNGNLSFFVNNDNASGVVSSEYGIIWGFDGSATLTKGNVPVARLTGLSDSTGNSDKAVMHQKAVTDAINTAKATITQSTGTSTTSVMSQKATSDAIYSASSVGISQAWQDMKSSRFIGVTYTNATGRPIVVSVCDGSVGSKFLSVDGVYVAYSAGDNADSTLTSIVPNGSTYLVTGTGTLLYWAELRK